MMPPANDLTGQIKLRWPVKNIADLIRVYQIRTMKNRHAGEQHEAGCNHIKIIAKHDKSKDPDKIRQNRIFDNSDS